MSNFRSCRARTASQYSLELAAWLSQSLTALSTEMYPILASMGLQLHHPDITRHTFSIVLLEEKKRRKKKKLKGGSNYHTGNFTVLLSLPCQFCDSYPMKHPSPFQHSSGCHHQTSGKNGESCICRDLRN